MKLTKKTVISAFILSSIYVIAIVSISNNPFQLKYEIIQIFDLLGAFVFIPVLILSSIWILIKSIIFLKKEVNYPILDITYYVFIVLFFIITLFPIQYKMGGYSLSPLGWLWLISCPGAILTFLWLLVIDIKENKKKKKILTRFLFIIVAIIAIYMKAKEII